MKDSNMKKKDKATVEIKSAKARKLEAEAERSRKEAREKEDQQWIDTKSRAAKRREEKAERQAEAAARKAFDRLLAKQEEKDLETMLNLKKLKKKATAAELQRKTEEEEGEEELQKQAKKERRKQTRVATMKEYESTILVENKNRSVIEARSFDEAIAVLTDRENLQVTKVKATRGNKGDYLLVYTQGEKKPLLFDVLPTV